MPLLVLLVLFAFATSFSGPLGRGEISRHCFMVAPLVPHKSAGYLAVGLWSSSGFHHVPHALSHLYDAAGSGNPEIWGVLSSE